MFDLVSCPATQKLAAEVYEKGGIVGAVCHGPASLINVQLSDGSYLLKGKKVTAFSNAEEAALTQSSSQVVPPAAVVAWR